MWDTEETRCRMCLFWYKQKIWQCEILLAHIGPIQTLKTTFPSLAGSVESTVDPTLWSDQVPPQGIREMGQPSMAKLDAAQADALTAVQWITQPLPPTLCTISGSIYLMDSDGASVAGTQGGSPSAITKKEAGR